MRSRFGLGEWPRPRREAEIERVDRQDPRCAHRSSVPSATSTAEPPIVAVRERAALNVETERDAARPSHLDALHDRHSLFSVGRRGEAHDDSGECGGGRAGCRVLADAPAGGEHARVKVGAVAAWRVAIDRRPVVGAPMADVGVGARQRLSARQRREDEVDARAINHRMMGAETDVGGRQDRGAQRSLRPMAPARLPAAGEAG